MSENELNAANPGHYVYLYRDLNDHPCYVGYGEYPSRADSPDHSDKLRKFIQEQAYTLEIAGPFGSEEAGRAVETALISAIEPPYNVATGSPIHQFRPLGVPKEFAHRLSEPALDKGDLVAITATSQACPILMVYVGRQSLFDSQGAERPGYDPASPLQDKLLLDRIVKWWELDAHVKKWHAHESSSPGLLVAVTGNPYARIIIASATINRSGWRSAETDGPFLSVPLIAESTPKPGELDALGLRGRRISPEANLKFNSVPSQQFILINCDGKVVGGRSV